jgi:hypothetical protein
MDLAQPLCIHAVDFEAKNLVVADVEQLAVEVEAEVVIILPGIIPQPEVGCRRKTLLDFRGQRLEFVDSPLREVLAFKRSVSEL